MTANQFCSSRTGLLPRAYVATWALLGGLAVSYLGLLAAKPDVVAGVTLLSPREIPAQMTAGSPAAPAPSSDVQALKETVAALEGELQALRGTLAQREAGEQALAARLAAVEASRSAETTPASARPATGTDSRADLDGRTVTGSIVEPTAPAKAPAAQQQVAFGTPHVKPARPTGILIATGPSVDALRLSWMLLSDRHKAVLKGLEPRFVAAPNGGTPAFRLIAGPVSNERAASRLCSQLRARRVICGVATFAGEAL